MAFAEHHRRQRNNEASRKWRAANPEEAKAAGKRWRDKNPIKMYEKGRRQVAAYNIYKDKPCTDCGGRFPPECMDFDHLPGFKKLGNIGHMIKSHKTRALVIAEIAKCEVVCANCHRIRTVKRAREAAYGLELSPTS